MQVNNLSNFPSNIIFDKVIYLFFFFSLFSRTGFINALTSILDALPDQEETVRPHVSLMHINISLFSFHLTVISLISHRIPC